MKQKVLIFVFASLFHLSGMAQTITGKIVDSKTGESIPYANILISGADNLISNEEGYFSISEKNDDASILMVSYLGYVGQQLTIGTLKKQNNIIKLQPGVFELEDVDVNKIKPNANAVMAKVKENIKKNHGVRPEAMKKTLFMREFGTFSPKKLDIEITKSTGFSKKALKEANADVASFTSKLMSNPPQEFTDVLANYYSGTVAGKEKPVFTNKLEVVKATKLKDENRAVSIDNMEKMAANIFLKHLDTTKYYRIKSGWFGSRDTISLRKDFNKKKKKKEKRTELGSAKTNLYGLLANNNVLGSRLDFANQTDLYEYTYEGAVYSAQNEFAYVIGFKPKKSKAKYTGKLYISEKDFAVLRADYNLAKGKTLGGLNVKWLLGIKASENVSNGTVIYKQNASGEGYYLQYASSETGQYFYLNRPLKFIELTDEDKDVVAVDIKVEGNMTEKVEFLNIAQADIETSALEAIKEEEFEYIRLKRYDPKIWKDYTSIEPLEEMKQFKVVEE